MKQYIFVITGIITVVVLMAAGGQIGGNPLAGGGGAPIASPTFTGIATAPTFNYTTSLTKNGTAVLAVNGCAAITTVAGTLTYNCTIAGGTSSSICWSSPTNATAATLLRGDFGIGNAGNPPFVSIAGTTATITFVSGSAIATVPNSATFSVACSV